MLYRGQGKSSPPPYRTLQTLDSCHTRNPANTCLHTGYRGRHPPVLPRVCTHRHHPGRVHPCGATAVDLPQTDDRLPAPRVCRETAGLQPCSAPPPAPEAGWPHAQPPRGPCPDLAREQRPGLCLQTQPGMLRRGAFLRVLLLLLLLVPTAPPRSRRRPTPGPTPPGGGTPPQHGWNPSQPPTYPQGTARHCSC